MRRLICRCWVLWGCLGVSQAAWGADGVLPGSTSAAFLNDVAAGSPQLDAAADFAQFTFLPALERRDHAWVALGQVGGLGGVLQVPANFAALCEQSTLDTCPYGQVRADAYEAQAGVGYRSDHYGAFYVASFLGSRAAFGSWYAATALASAGLAIGNLVTAPLTAGPTRLHHFSAMATGFDSVATQYMLGATGQWDAVHVRLAYTGGDADHGIVASADGPLGLHGAVVLRPGVGDVPYAWLGLWRSNAMLAWLFPETTDLPPAPTSLYMRTLGWSVPGAASVPVRGTLFWTAHFEQWSIPLPAGAMDIMLALALYPQVTLHQAQLSWHTASFHDDDNTHAWFDVGVTGGVVGMPVMDYFGHSGGAHIAAGVYARYGTLVRLALEYNPPEWLARLPWAEGVTRFTFQLDRDLFIHG